MKANGYTKAITGSEPVTLTEAKLHLRVDISTDDDLITRAIEAAREYVEGYLERVVTSATITAKYDALGAMELPINGALSVTSVKYLDSDSVEQTASSALYLLDNFSTPNAVLLKNNQDWPSVIAQKNAVEIVYTAGYAGSPPDWPSRVQNAILLLVGDMYENRESAIIGTIVAKNEAVDRLLFPLREVGI